MPIVVRLDVMLARRKVKARALAEYVGISEVNMSLLKQGKVKGVRFETLERICRYLDCQPGDLLACEPDRHEGRTGQASDGAVAARPGAPLPDAGGIA